MRAVRRLGTHGVLKIGAWAMTARGSISFGMRTTSMHLGAHWRIRAHLRKQSSRASPAEVSIIGGALGGAARSSTTPCPRIPTPVASCAYSVAPFTNDGDFAGEALELFVDEPGCANVRPGGIDVVRMPKEILPLAVIAHAPSLEPHREFPADGPRASGPPCCRRRRARPRES